MDNDTYKLKYIFLQYYTYIIKLYIFHNAEMKQLWKSKSYLALIHANITDVK